MEHSRAANLDPVYAAPHSTPQVSDPAAVRLRTRGGKLLLASVAGFGLSIVAMPVTNSVTVGTLLFLGSALVALVGAGHGIAALTKGAAVGGTVAVLFGNLFMTGLGAFAAFLSTVTFTRGRQ